MTQPCCYFCELEYNIYTHKAVECLRCGATSCMRCRNYECCAPRTVLLITSKEDSEEKRITHVLVGKNKQHLVKLLIKFFEGEGTSSTGTSSTGTSSTGTSSTGTSSTGTPTEGDLENIIDKGETCPGYNNLYSIQYKYVIIAL